MKKTFLTHIVSMKYFRFYLNILRGESHTGPMVNSNGKLMVLGVPVLKHIIVLGYSSKIMK